jgi:hypothetical protein
MKKGINASSYVIQDLKTTCCSAIVDERKGL